MLSITGTVAHIDRAVRSEASEYTQGAEFEICDPGVSLWIKNTQNQKNTRHCLLYLGKGILYP